MPQLQNIKHEKFCKGIVLDGLSPPNAYEPGMVAGFPAGGSAHHLENRTDRDCVILELGDRTEGDKVNYPADDIQAVLGSDGTWRFAHKTGEAY